MDRRKPELLSPAGDMEKLRMAIAYGADAVYLAGTSFGMRSFTGNFTPEELPKAVALAHEAGVKVHCTVNIMPRNDEAAALPAYLEQLDAAGVDALILADLGAFAAVFRENPDYRRLLTEPSIPKAEREALLDEAWKDALHPYTLNFVKLLCANGTVSQLPDCETVYRARYNEDNNILAVTAVSAAPMREELQEKLRQKLEAKTGKHVELTVKVEPDLIGGVKLTMGGVQYDGTVRHHLDELQRILQTNSN